MPKKQETNVVQFQNAGLPADPAAFAQALGNVTVHTGMGKDILKLTRQGEWLFGADSIEVEDVARVAFNPYTLMHGGVQWDDGQKIDEHMASITQVDPMIALQLDRGLFDAQMSIEGVIVGGEDDGTEVVYVSSSKGGIEAIGILSHAIGQQMSADPGKCVPVVALDTSHYNHKKYGKIYKPVLTVEKWIALDAKPEADAPAEAPADANPPTRSRRRRS